MEFTVKDRILLLNEVLPQFDSMSGIVTKMSIAEKLKLSDEENGGIVCKRLPTGVMEVGFKDVEGSLLNKEIELTDEELYYVKKRVRMIDSNGMISADNIATYQKVLDEPYADEGYLET
ncbi:MAG: hypothetical protein LBG96_07540 [Tannerella sp.]|jgi:hypothetical protein|nr:hypothetical protein [Tannerella sp.]